LIGLGAAAVLIAAVACTSGDGDEPAGSNNAPPAGSATDIVNKQLPPAVGVGSSEPAVAIGAPAPPQGFVEGFQPGVSAGRVGSSLSNGQQAGIWVNGMGQVLVEPDVATLYIGVESREATVSDARQAAADAMQRVFDAVQAEGVAEDDIVTTSFNVYPQQIWKEIREESGSYSAPEIVGYVVSNTVQIKIRDLDTVGAVVDAAADEAGDLVRINTIQFGIDNPSQYAQQLRRLAAEDARAKAQVYADALGVTLGPIVFLTETGSSAPVIVQAEAAAFDGAVARAPTPIRSGDTSLSSSVQAVFAILSS
jgi:uncharacterized protein YggE